MLPFVVGILLAINFHLPSPGIFILLALLPAALVLLLQKKPSHSSKRFFVLCADLFLLCYGITVAGEKELSKQTSFYGNMVRTDSVVKLLVVVADVPVEKERSMKYDLKVLEVKKGERFEKTEGNLIAYFAKKGAYRLAPGACLYLKTKLQKVNAPANPYEFDYRNYLSNRQVYHTAFVDSGGFKVLDSPLQLNSLWYYGLLCKQFILKKLRHNLPDDNSYSICAALLTGFDDEIDRPVMEAFSHSGTLHVLSVSGLHTGLIYLVLNFLFDLADRKRKYKMTRFFLVTIILWFFALITGFSAPVLRAVIMFNLLGMGRIWFREGYRNQLNILLVSAFVLLVYNPFYIVDVGFLLSYFALCGLIYFQPRFAGLWRPRQKAVNYAWQSVSASLAATLSTLPITLFYFKQFPVWFFICNLVVVPLSFVILLLSLFVIINVPLVPFLINLLVKILLWFIGLFNSSRFGYVDNIHFSMVDVWCLAALILLFSIAIHYRSFVQIRLALLLLIGWQFISIFISFQAKKQDLFAAYSIKNRSVCVIKNQTRVCLPRVEKKDFDFHVKPHLISFNYAQVDTLDFNYVRAGAEGIFILNKPGNWPRGQLPDVNTLVLCNNFEIYIPNGKNKKDSINFRTCFPNLRRVVADMSNNSLRLKQARDLCRNFDLVFYDLKKTGIFLLPL